MRNTPKYNGERAGGTCGRTCAAAGSTAGSAAAGRGLLSDSLPPGRCGPPGTQGGEGARSDAAAPGGREGEVGGRGTAMPPRRWGSRLVPGWVLGGCWAGAAVQTTANWFQCWCSSQTGGHGDASSPPCAHCFGWTRVSRCHTWWPLQGLCQHPGALRAAGTAHPLGSAPVPRILDPPGLCAPHGRRVPGVSTAPARPGGLASAAL